MKIKTTLAALALMIAPVSAMAMEGCGWGHAVQQDTATLCAEGQTFNETLGICVTSATS